jgi:cysteine-S-conjugate beta-lyase
VHLSLPARTLNARCDCPGEYDYSRSGNPTRNALEQQICELEGGHKGFAFSSGMAALSAVTRLVKPGQEIILNDDSYGGTYRLLSKVAARNHVRVRYVDMSGAAGPANLRAAISENTRLLMIESPTNPMQRILDIRAITAIAHEYGALVEVDSTMMSPCLQQPLALGADLVVHSATKFISGHSDCMAGVVVVKDRALAEQVRWWAPHCVACLCWTLCCHGRASTRFHDLTSIVPALSSSIV